MRFLAVAALALALGCDAEIEDFDQFPIPVDTSAGPVLVQARAGESAAFWATVDTLAPLSVLDGQGLGGAAEPPRRRQIDLTLLAETGADQQVPRAGFPDVTVIDLNPCGTGSACPVGPAGATRSIGGVIGADLLSRGAVRFDFAASSITLFPEIAGTAKARARACDAVFDAPFYGGGTLLISGGEVDFPGLRVAVGACADFDAENPITGRQGVAMALILSTGLGTTIISESAYARYRSFYADDPSQPPVLGALPAATVHIASGPINGRLGQLQRLALVGEGSEDRGPCKELYANHVLTLDACRQPSDLEVPVCPCTDSQFCSTAGAVEIQQLIDVLVVPDDEPLLQALRDELRPALPEVDGLLGVSALTATALDVDYPNGRLLLRCTDPAACTARPAVIDSSSLIDLQRCPGV